MATADGSGPDSGGTSLSGLFRQLVRLRDFEEAVSVEFRAGRIPGIVHLGIGQEAVAAGVSSTLTEADLVVSNHRGHCHLLAKGAPMRGVMAEIFGRATGVCGGKGGSMHLAHMESGNIGANGVVGGGLPIAAGLGMAIRQLGDERVVVAYAGDGTISTGAFHEALVLISLENLPVLIVVENNEYAETTGAAYHLAGGTVAQRLAGYGIESVEVDGMDVLEVAEAATSYVTEMRADRRPRLLEAHTYRYHGHYEGEFANYRMPPELASARARDPIARMRARCLSEGIAEGTLDELIDESRREVADAVSFASSSAFPTPDQVTVGVYS